MIMYIALTQTHLLYGFYEPDLSFRHKVKYSRANFALCLRQSTGDFFKDFTHTHTHTVNKRMFFMRSPEKDVFYQVREGERDYTIKFLILFGHKSFWESSHQKIVCFPPVWPVKGRLIRNLKKKKVKILKKRFATFQMFENRTMELRQKNHNIKHKRT